MLQGYVAIDGTEDKKLPAVVKLPVLTKFPLRLSSWSRRQGFLQRVCFYLHALKGVAQWVKKLY